MISLPNWKSLTVEITHQENIIESFFGSYTLPYANAGSHSQNSGLNESLISNE